MSDGGLAGIQLFKLSCVSESPKFLGNKTHFPLSESRLGLDSKRVNLVISPPMASVSGSGAEYFEQLLGAKPKQKKERIAGIDQDELLDPTLLADPDSCFCEFKGIQIHHKVCDLESPAQNLLQDPISSISPSRTKIFGLPMVLLHGFGASVFSWQWVMKPLAQVTGSKVLAFDRPAFGLTSRVNPYDHYSSSNSENIKPLNPYSMMFSVLATLHLIDFLAAEKAVLVGHSAGSLVAVNTYFEAPERVAALVLVAPAILAPLIAPKVVKENQSKMDTKTQWHGDDSNLNVQSNPFIRLCDILSKFSKHIVRAIMRLVKGMGEMLNFLYKKALSAVLRSAFAVMLTRMVIDKFAIAAVRNSWYDSNQVTEHVLHGYTKPLRAKGWDKALVEYIAAMLTDSSPNSKPPLVNRFNEISCPVLIVTGDCDRLVPSWNAERLSRVIPGSCLEVIKNCGHLPQEEKAEEFVSIVDKFLHRVLGGSQEQYLQTIT
ncbi:2-hydroxy-6-oxononadienedioate/2-hydroxy-6- oxononatrienedioate hydrolase [Actinidia chinensis var. chinensis]|uniref:2-hydroxy-6-oxononadienedioate/2-hydroxy-6-oxononatrienedioate hydrolase n=1 Tax=Actinidia chinensis var. chinensis TaxID=1590841 RepID=A0A2R6RR38_ACTCC|nr:2-hydroxy-6-oxononadienedioate/2-hydroxy-6- oxononatrienedioate hydrolase [Actinidia chinensis var. chinensis]